MLDDLEQNLPEELINSSSVDGIANGETADIASTSSSSLQRMLQSNSDVLTSSASTTFSTTSASATSISSPNSPSLTTLTPAKSPNMNYTMSSPPSMPVSTSGTPTPATPLTSSEHHLSSVLANSAPSSNSVTLSTMNSASGMQPSNMSISYSQGQHNMLDMNNLPTSMMASLNGTSVGNALNSMNMVQRNGPTSYSHSNSIGTNMNVSSSSANVYDTLSHIQSDPSFMNSPGLNGSLDPVRSLQGNQVMFAMSNVFSLLEICRHQQLCYSSEVVFAFGSIFFRFGGQFRTK